MASMARNEELVLVLIVYPCFSNNMSSRLIQSKVHCLRGPIDDAGVVERCARPVAQYGCIRLIKVLKSDIRMLRPAGEPVRTKDDVPVSRPSIVTIVRMSRVLAFMFSYP